MKTHWRNLSEQHYLGAWDLEEDGKFKTILVTIERIFTDQFKGAGPKQKKAFIKLKEFDKPMVCNTSNFTRLETRFNTFDHSKFINQQVILQVEKADNPSNRGSQVDALRFSQRTPPSQTVQKKTITNERLDDAMVAINDEEHKMTKESFLSSYTLDELQTVKFNKTC